MPNSVVGQYVEIALAKACLGVLEAVPFGGQGAQGLGGHLQALHADAGFVCAGSEERSAGRDEVADVKGLQRVAIDGIAEGSLVQVELDFT